MAGVMSCGERLECTNLTSKPFLRRKAEVLLLFYYQQIKDYDFDQERIQNKPLKTTRVFIYVAPSSFEAPFAVVDSATCAVLAE